MNPTQKKNKAHFKRQRKMLMREYDIYLRGKSRGMDRIPNGADGNSGWVFFILHQRKRISLMWGTA